ncbi:hypothetical protein EV426DRAFT_709616 [Tirmania nivea]|nr:hypothetical protein EV426DRAFT_709616 [Tirmania nivea]
MESQGNAGRGRPGWEVGVRKGGGFWVAVVIGRKYYILEAAWDTVGEYEVERERCLSVAERGRRWVESADGGRSLGQLEYGGSQCIHVGFTEEVVEAATFS